MEQQKPGSPVRGDVLVKCQETGVPIGYVPEGDEYHKEWISGTTAVELGIPTHTDSQGNHQPVAVFGKDADGNYLNEQGDPYPQKQRIQIRIGA